MSLTRRVSIGVLVLALGASVAACGGGGAKPKNAAASKDAGSTTTSTTVVGGSPGGSNGGSSGSGGSTPNTTTKGGSPNSGGAQTATTATVPNIGTLKLDVSFSQPCIKPGTPQTITVKVDTKEKVAVAYNTEYSDGNNWKSPNYYGGNKGGVVDDGSGTYKDTWVLSPQAAAGPAQVAVFATMKDNGGSASAQFKVADKNGHC